MSEPRKSVRKAHNPPVAPQWDRFSIAAEATRRGLSMVLISRQAGLYDAACSLGLIGRSRRGAEAVAAALNIPFDELFANITPYDTQILKAKARNDLCADGTLPQVKNTASTRQMAGGR